MNTFVNQITPIHNSTSQNNRFLIVIAIMSATLMQVLDTTIVNVALPHMQGSFGASPDQISWTLTTYMVSSAIIMPLTGYFSDFFGRKNYLLGCIIGFTLSSTLCGAANSLSTMILFRLLQGIFGAALVPLSQAILVDIYPPKELGKAMAIWGTGVMVGPVLGPTLGGYLTEIASWRWTFYINVPVGIFAAILAWRALPATLKKSRSFDWIGFIMLGVAIGATQYLLDRGNQEDWFNAFSIKFSALLAFLGYVSFIIYNYFNRSQPVFDFRVLKDRNFTIACIMILILGVGLYGSMVILPLLLENLLNYPVFTTGLIMTPRAIAVMLSMIIMGKISDRLNPRFLIVAGILLSSLGVYFCTFYSLDLNKFWLIWPMMIQGFGLGMIFVPISAMAFATLPQKLRVEGAGVNSLLRTIGGSIGIAITLTIFTRQTQMAWNQLAGFIQPYNPALMQYLKHLSLSLTNPLTPSILGSQLAIQAQMLAFVNVFAFIMWSFIILLPLVMLLKLKKKIDV